jgi:hypothetical protein
MLSAVVRTVAPVRCELSVAPGALTGPVTVAAHVGVLTAGDRVLLVEPDGRSGVFVLVARW